MKKKKSDGQYNVKIPVKGKPLEENDIKLVVFFFFCSSFDVRRHICVSLSQSQINIDEWTRERERERGHTRTHKPTIPFNWVFKVGNFY